MKNHTCCDKFTQEVKLNDTLLDIMSVAYVVLNTDNKILTINGQALKELEVQKDVTGEELSRFLTIFLGKEDIFQNLLQALAEDSETIELPINTYFRIHENGKKFFVKGQIIGHYTDGQLTHIHLIFRNIETELTQGHILNMALSRTKIFPWFYDMDLNKMIIDARWFTHLGFSTRDCTLDAVDFTNLVHPDDRENLANALARHFNGEEITDAFTYRLHRQDGAWEWFEGQSIYLGEVNGLPYRIVGVCQSIQEYKTVEENLTIARDKAQESDRLKSAFLANMSHEIRTPLNAIVGFSNLITSGEVEFDDAETQEYVRLINTNSEQLLILISDILDISKIESNTMEFHCSNQLLNRLLSDIYHSQKLNMPAGVQLILELPDKDFLLNTDPMRLKQIINNLINNAIKFTVQGSISFGYHIVEAEKQVEFFVRDTGKGIAPEHLSRIFERFYKADAFRSGVGLGLPICKTIIEHFGGSISCTSEPEVGTCFIVRHPQ